MVLRWQFRQDNRLLTCGISPAEPSGFDVVTMPHWDISQGSVERFDCATEALRRHAAIASALRGAGWTAASYSR
jgi:hypothetical protein